MNDKSVNGKVTRRQRGEKEEKVDKKKMNLHKIHCQMYARTYHFFD
jgi:hypothetical protein